MRCKNDITYVASDCSDFPDLSPLMAEHLRQVNIKHEEVIKTLLRKILGREVVNEDAKDLTMIQYPGDIMDYDLAYKGTRIGRVVFTFNGPNFTITFKPDAKYSCD